MEPGNSTNEEIITPHCEIPSIPAHFPEPHDLGPDGFPKNSFPFGVRLCFDTRGDECFFACDVKCSNKFVNFDKRLCLYEYRMNMEQLEYPGESL